MYIPCIILPCVLLEPVNMIGYHPHDCVICQRNFAGAIKVPNQ